MWKVFLRLHSVFSCPYIVIKSIAWHCSGLGLLGWYRRTLIENIPTSSHRLLSLQSGLPLINLKKAAMQLVLTGHVKRSFTDVNLYQETQNHLCRLDIFGKGFVWTSPPRAEWLLYLPLTLTLNKKFWEELIAYFPWYDTGNIENDGSNNSSTVACVFVIAVTFLPSRCLATIGGFLPSCCLATIRGFLPSRCIATIRRLYRAIAYQR
jgi:hypothetical protein